MGRYKKSTRTPTVPRSTRNSKGQFVKGNPGGPGRPTAERESSYLRAVREAVSTAKMAQLADKLFADALAGCVASARLLCDHLLPKATDRLRIEQEFLIKVSDQELRVAGMTPGQLRLHMLEQLQERERQEQALLERAEYEQADPRRLATNVVSEQ